jgi:hypothetical protein
MAKVWFVGYSLESLKEFDFEQVGSIQIFRGNVRLYREQILLSLRREAVNLHELCACFQVSLRAAKDLRTSSGARS